MSKTFDAAVQIVLELEGGYTDDAADPGGKTRFGITEAVARAHGYQGDMRELPMPVALAIYRADYWDACQCDAMPWPLSMYVFDAAVNQGTGAAVKMLQRALNTVQDGKVGPVTLRLAKQSNAWHWTRFMAYRVMRYQSTRGFDTFGTGWLSRCFRIAMEGK